jgi:hypothetical protein
MPPATRPKAELLLELSFHLIVDGELDARYCSKKYWFCVRLRSALVRDDEGRTIAGTFVLSYACVEKPRYQPSNDVRP